NNQEHSRPAIDSGITEAWLRSGFYSGNPVKGHGTAVFGLYYRAGQLSRAADFPFPSHQDSLVRVLDEASRPNPSGLARGVEDVGQRQRGGLQGLRPDLDLELAYLTPEDGDLGHATNRQQPWADRPLGQVAQLHGRQCVG